ncbi:MAG TPA: DUF5681 domain-containing protein [Rhizomicrobium sp.]
MVFSPPAISGEEKRMSGEYAVGYGKPPVHSRFQKGQSGNPSGKPGPAKTRRYRFAQKLEAALLESTETVAHMPCTTNLAAGAKGMALDMVRGKTPTIRLIFDLLDELDGVPRRRRRARVGHLVDEMDVAPDATDAQASQDQSQRVTAEEPLRMWCEYAREPVGRSGSASGSALSLDLSWPAREACPPAALRADRGAGHPDGTRSIDGSDTQRSLQTDMQSAPTWVARSSAGHDKERGSESQPDDAAHYPAQGIAQAINSEAPETERHLLAVAAMAPDKETLHRDAHGRVASQPLERRSDFTAQGIAQAINSETAETERHLLTVAAMKPDKDELRRIAWEKGQERNRRLDASIRAKLEKAMSRTTPLTEEEKKKIEEARANEGPAKRALSARFERLIEANRLEAERKAALAVVRPAHPVRQAHHEGKEETLTLSSSKGEPNPEPLPDFSIWMRGQPVQMP